MNLRGFAWTDENVEHSDEDQARAEALMCRWSAIHHEEEQESFRREADREDGGYEPEPDECETCGGEGVLVPLCHGRNERGRLLYFRCESHHCTGLVNIKCPNPNCEDGRDVTEIREAEKRRTDRLADRALEKELIVDKLAAIGARVMRPYEHWNEEERYMQYMEEGRFGHTSE